MSARVTVADPGGNDAATVRIDADAGDGAAPCDGAGATLTYARPGVCTITATATDDDGATGTAQATIVVRDPSATGGWVLGGGKLDGSVRIGRAGKVFAGAVLLHDAAGNRAMVAWSPSCRSPAAQARCQAPGCGAAVGPLRGQGVDGGATARDTVRVRVLSTGGAVLWQTDGARPLHPGAAVVKPR